MSFQDWEDSEFIPDPDAKKPADWNEAIDGEWEGPLIPNLKYKVSGGGYLSSGVRNKTKVR